MPLNYLWLMLHLVYVDYEPLLMLNAVDVSILIYCYVVLDALFRVNDRFDFGLTWLIVFYMVQDYNIA